MSFAPVYSHLPEEIDNNEPITRQRVTCGQLFKFTHWQGVGLMKHLYQVGVVFLSVFYFILFIVGFFGGAAGIVFSLIIVPFLFVLQLMILRVMAEALLSVLLLPQYFRPTEANMPNAHAHTGYGPSVVVAGM